MRRGYSASAVGGFLKQPALMFRSLRSAASGLRGPLCFNQCAADHFRLVCLARCLKRETSLAKSSGADRGKRRSTSQRTGEQGESVFAAWAVSHRLTATKASADYGIDYFCQIFSAVGVHEEATGGVLAVQVKTTNAGSKPTVFLDRTDAVNLVRQEQPTCLFGIGLATKTVYFRFVDETFINELLFFLTSQKGRLGLPLSSMSTGSELFGKQLRNIAKAATQQRIRIYRVELEARLRLPDAEVEVTQSSRGGVATLTAKWIGSAFHVHPDIRETVRTEFFGLGIAPEIEAGIVMRPELLPVFSVADSSVILQGGIEGEELIQVKNGDKTAEASFKVRNFGDEWSFTHDSGLCLIMSEPRNFGGGQVKHDLYVHLAQGVSSLGALGEGIDFLKLLGPGSFFSRGGRAWMELDHWGRSLTSIGSAIEMLGPVCGSLGIDLHSCFLNDFVNREFVASIVYVNAILTGKYSASEMFPGVLYNVDSSIPASEAKSRKVRVRLPLVMNVKDVGVIIWLKTGTRLYFNEEGLLCGLQPETLLSWEVELTSRFTKSAHPELWISNNLPAVECGSGLHKAGDEVRMDFESVDRHGIVMEILES